MTYALPTLALALLLTHPAPANARDAAVDSVSAAPARVSEPGQGIQCVPYARQVSGIQIFGDAHSWWGQAQGRYATGNRPRVGAVLAFQPHRNMVLGHVATVSKVIDSRSVLLDHANWSPIDGRRGQVEQGVLAVDASPGNDWSEVRVWYAPIGALGTTAWPTSGFIYADKAGRVGRTQMARAQTEVPPPNEAQRDPSKKFLKVFASFQ